MEDKERERERERERAVAGVGETRTGTSENTFSSGERDPIPFKGWKRPGES